VVEVVEAEEPVVEEARPVVQARGLAARESLGTKLRRQSMPHHARR
jgi:hypothetical protein